MARDFNGHTAYFRRLKGLFIFLQFVLGTVSKIFCNFQSKFSLFIELLKYIFLSTKIKNLKSKQKRVVKHFRNTHKIYER